MPDQDEPRLEGFDEPGAVRSDRSWERGSAEWAGNESTFGTLVIDVFDAKAKQLVWRAYCSADARKSSDGQQVRDAVTAAFRHFP